MKEIKIILNTGEKGSEFTTENIKGRIKGVILSNEKKADILIKSELGYVIFKEMERSGTHYFPLKISPLDKKAHKVNFAFDDFYLNEKLIISLNGTPNTDMTIIIRYTE